LHVKGHNSESQTKPGPPKSFVVVRRTSKVVPTYPRGPVDMPNLASWLLESPQVLAGIISRQRSLVALAASPAIPPSLGQCNFSDSAAVHHQFTAVVRILRS